MEETDGMVITLDVKRRDGEKFAMQASKDVFFEVRVSVSQDCIREGEGFFRRIGAVDAPTGLKVSLIHGLWVAGDGELKANCLLDTCRFASVGTNASFVDQGEIAGVKEVINPVLLDDFVDLSLQGDCVVDLVFATSFGWGESL